MMDVKKHFLLKYVKKMTHTRQIFIKNFSIFVAETLFPTSAAPQPKELHDMVVSQ